MNIVILGADRIGQHLATILSEEEHNVVLIDKCDEKLDKIAKETDVAIFKGYGSSTNVLENLLEFEPDLFVALSEDDETNLVACCMAKNLGYPVTVARVKRMDFLYRAPLDFAKLFFVDHFIGAEILTAHEILKDIINPGNIAIENFAHGAIQMRTLHVPKKWSHVEVPIAKLDFPKDTIISLIRRKVSTGEDEIIFPHGSDMIFPDDEITIIGETHAMHTIQEYFQHPEKKINSIMIVGGGEVGYRLAFILEKQDISVRIIESDEKRCEQLALMLPKCSILHRDISQMDFFEVEQTHDIDATVAATDSDETNILISIWAKHFQCKQIISLINDVNLKEIAKELGIQCCVSGTVNIVNRVLSIMHMQTISAIATLYENKAKVLEIKVSPDSDIIGVPLSELSRRLPKEFLIAAIENRGKVLIGRGDRFISPHDVIIAIVDPKYLKEIQEMF